VKRIGHGKTLLGAFDVMRLPFLLVGYRLQLLPPESDRLLE
jgi:hypothetical protein